MSIFVKAFRWWVALFNPLTVFCWCVGAIIAGGAATGYFTTLAPGTLLSIAEDADYSVSDDGKLILFVHLDKHRYCPVDTHRWLERTMAINGQKIPIWRYLGNIPAPPTPLGMQTYGIELDIPAPWDVAGTNYASRSNYHCGFGQLLEPQQTQVGPMPIDVGGKGKP